MNKLIESKNKKLESDAEEKAVYILSFRRNGLNGSPPDETADWILKIRFRSKMFLIFAEQMHAVFGGNYYIRFHCKPDPISDPSPTLTGGKRMANELTLHLGDRTNSLSLSLSILTCGKGSIMSYSFFPNSLVTVRACRMVQVRQVLQSGHAIKWNN